MTNELKPTNEEIVEYIYMWFIKLKWSKSDPMEVLKDSNFQSLREMFATVMYDSIQECADSLDNKS